MQVLGAATFINAAPGHILCHQGEVGDRFFAIIEGMVSIHVRPKIEIESALATAAESKGSGNQLIKTMLAALSQHRVEVGAGACKSDIIIADKIWAQPKQSVIDMDLR